MLIQVFIISMQSFTALDISSQALVASYLGRVSLVDNIPAETSLMQICRPHIAQAKFSG